MCGGRGGLFPNVLNKHPPPKKKYNNLMNQSKTNPRGRGQRQLLVVASGALFNFHQLVSLWILALFHKSVDNVGHFVWNFSICEYFKRNVGFQNMLPPVSACLRRHKAASSRKKIMHIVGLILLFLSIEKRHNLGVPYSQILGFSVIKFTSYYMYNTMGVNSTAETLWNTTL